MYMYVCVHAFMYCSKTVTDTHLIFGTIVHLYNTYHPYQAWGSHEYGDYLVGTTVQTVLQKMALSILHFCFSVQIIDQLVLKLSE